MEIKISTFGAGEKQLRAVAVLMTTLADIEANTCELSGLDKDAQPAATVDDGDGLNTASAFAPEPAAEALAAGHAGDDAQDDADMTTAAEPDGPVDENGVVKDEKFVGDAKDPFYGTGKRKGQWKKRKGVSEEDYDAWYASAPRFTADAGGEGEQVNTAAAFGGAQQQNAEKTVTDAGGLMLWFSEQTTAGKLEQADLMNAYSELKLDPLATMAGPNRTQEEADQNVQNVYNVLLGYIEENG